MKELNNKNTAEMMENNVVEATQEQTNEVAAKQEQTEELVHCKKAFMTDYDKVQMLNCCKHFLDEEMKKRNIAEIEQADIDKMKIKIAVDKEIGSNFQSMMHGITVMALVDVSNYFATRVQVREKSLKKCFKVTMEKAKEMCANGDGMNRGHGMAVSSSIVIPWIIEYYLAEVTQKEIEEYEKELKEEEARKERLKKAKENSNKAKSKSKAKSSTAPKEPSLFDQVSEESTAEDEISTEVTETTLEVKEETSSTAEVVETTKVEEVTKSVKEEVIETTPEPKEDKVPQFEAISLFDL